MLATMKALGRFTKPYRGMAVTASILTIIFATLAVVDPYVTGLIIDWVLKGKPASYVVNGALLIIGVTLVRTWLRYAYFMMFERYSQKIVYDLRKTLYKKLQSLDFTYFDKTPNGNIMTKMTGDIEAIRHFYAWVTHVSIFHGLVFVLAIMIMIYISPLLTASLILVVPFITWFSLKLSRSVRPIFSKIREMYSVLNTVVQENISGNRVVKAFAREPFEINKFDEKNQAFMDANIEAAKVRETYEPVLEGFAVLFNVMVLLLGSLMIIFDQLSVGELVAFNRLLWMINNPLRMLGAMINGTQNYIASYERVEELLIEESDLKELAHPIREVHLKGYVNFNNVGFQYDNMPVLRNINFSVEPGQTVAILGATGSGKSTLTALISRFYDVDSGEITIDGIPIKSYDLHTLRNNISVAMQDIFLFSDTIEGNITYGVPQADPKKVRLAAEIAGVHEFIDQFDDSYNTIVGERGVGLSGGQKQRIALARAIIEDPSILILDDTTSAVDMETEYKILTELKKINQERTTFIIAHRISSVKDADLILVMEGGEIIERGTHQSLLDEKGYYYEVFSSQMGEFDYKAVKEGA